MSALDELRRHSGLGWKKMGREGMKQHLNKSLANIADEQQKVCDKLGVVSVTPTPSRTSSKGWGGTNN